MLAIAAVAAVVALAITGWAIAGVLERFVTAGIDRRLDSQVALLATAVGADGRIDRNALAQRRGALEAGRDWRWTIATRDGTVGAADLARRAAGPPGALPPPPPLPLPGNDDRLGPVDGATADGTALHARALTLATARGPVTITAAAPPDVIRRPIRDALVPLLAVLAALAGVLAAATAVQVRVGLRPLRRLRDQVSAIRSGQRGAVDEDQPAELMPLAIELNALTRDNAAALATARLSAANLAHALKTPVSALALELRNDAPRAAQVARIDRTIQHHLARARAQTIDTRAATRLRPAIDDLVRTIAALYRERPIATQQVFDVDDPLVAMDPRDVDELIGNLLDNAAKHAAALVQVHVAPDVDPRFVHLTISDDGAGIPEAERARVALPGIRLDEQAAGHGFGLGIAIDLAALYGGTLRLSAAAGGGLCVQLRLPRVAERDI